MGNSFSKIDSRLEERGIRRKCAPSVDGLTLRRQTLAIKLDLELASGAPRQFGNVN